MPSSTVPVEGSERIHPEAHVLHEATDPTKNITIDVIVRRRSGGSAKSAFVAPAQARLSRDEFAEMHGADPADLADVAKFATDCGLQVLDTDAARRSVAVSGPVSAVNAAFGVELTDYKSPRGTYYSHSGPALVPAELADKIEAVIGLDSRKINAVHHATSLTAASADPPNTVPLTPQQVAALYNFPSGTGQGQTIGLYEMETSDGPAGYSQSDISQTMAGFGVPVPNIIDVPVGATGNSGVSDGETGLDITVAGAVARSAQLAVYFAGPQNIDIIHALQKMIHPKAGEPIPTVISISYSWGADDPGGTDFSAQDLKQIGQLFQDAANLSITVFVSTGDHGVIVVDRTRAQASYPATEPGVTACGGTTIGDIRGATFTEFIWNDSGATGGGISAMFPVPSYQATTHLGTQVATGQTGRGVPDLAGNASANSGYMQVIQGQPPQPVGGTSAVAPLYAALIAIINANLGRSVGFINDKIYAAGPGVFRPVTGPPGPVNNSFGGVQGYPAGTPWNACTGLGSVDGTRLQAIL